MTGFATAELTTDEESAPHEAKVTRRGDSSPVTLAVCGEETVGRALALLLRNFRYDVRFLPASTLGRPQSLDGVHLLLLTPTARLSGGHREALLTLLKDEALTAKIPILELSSYSERTQGEEWVESECIMVRWPCSTEELKRRIEETLANQPHSKSELRRKGAWE